MSAVHRESVRDGREKCLYHVAQMNQLKPTCIWHLLIQMSVIEHLFLCVPVNMKKLCLILRGLQKAVQAYRHPPHLPIIF